MVINAVDWGLACKMTPPLCVWRCPQSGAAFLGSDFNPLLPSFRKSKTKPNGKKPPAEEKKHYLEPEYTKVRVVDFDLKELVVLPPEIDLNEWLASNSKINIQCICFGV